MNYCSNCGSAEIGLKIPEGDNRPRFICPGCDEIFYHNPKVVVGCVPVHGEQVLLCKRAIQPRRGWWTLPAGYMENQESAATGAGREAAEEALAEPEVGMLYTHFSIPHINQVYMMFLAHLAEPQFGVGEESLEVALFDEQDIPWDELAFPVMRKTLELFFDDRRAGRFRMHSGEITYPSGDRTRPHYEFLSTD
jgi:ADP-ribose pyrophosphatase YjhB (NUDIX family)